MAAETAFRRGGLFGRHSRAYVGRAVRKFGTMRARYSNFTLVETRRTSAFSVIGPYPRVVTDSTYSGMPLRSRLIAGSVRHRAVPTFLVAYGTTARQSLFELNSLSLRKGAICTRLLTGQ